MYYNVSIFWKLFSNLFAKMSFDIIKSIDQDAKHVLIHVIESK